MGSIADAIFGKSRKSLPKTQKPTVKKRTTKSYTNIPSEFDEQSMLVKWLRLKKIRFASTPNENNMSKLNKKTAIIQGAKAKQTGMAKGFPDITIFLDKKVLFIEMKRSKKSLSKTSEYQKEWVDFLDSKPYASSVVCYGWSEAKSFIEKYL